MIRNRSICLLISIAVVLSMIGGSSTAASLFNTGITLKYYDDRMDVSGLDVEITDAGIPTSYKVGYGVAEGTPDSSVLTLENGFLRASGVGSAKVKINGTEHAVSVSPAPLSLILLMGQSNMEGSDGKAEQSVANTDGQVYATYGSRTELTEANAATFVPSAISGEGSRVNCLGTTSNIEKYPVNMLCASGEGKQGMDSGLAYEWNMRTGTKVWVVNVASGGSTQDSWSYGNENYKRAVATMSAVTNTLKKEISAGHYTLDRYGYFWCQGESDAARSAEHYMSTFLAMHESLKRDLALDHDGDSATENVSLQFANVVMIRAATNVGGAGYRQGQYAPTSLPIETSYTDLQMTGPRAAFYLMAQSRELADINIVSNITEKWVTMPDGSDGVASYFKEHYDGGRVSYPVQVAQPSYWYTPKLPSDVHPTVHYSQIGYNEIGRDAAKNACILLGESEPDSLKATVKLISWDGFTEFDPSGINGTVGSHSLAIPVAEPVYCAKNINLTLSDTLTYSHGDLTGNGNITASVAPLENAPDLYRWEYAGGELVSGEGYKENRLIRLSGTTAEDGTFSSTQYAVSRSIALLSERCWSVEWKAEGGEYMLLASGAKASDKGTLYLQVSKANNSISIGERTSIYDGCGVDLSKYGISVAEMHTYRLVNVPNENGDFRVDLYVDSQYVAPLTEHCKGGAFDGTQATVPASGDLLFDHIGASPYALRSCKIEYLEINEGIEVSPPDESVTWGDIDGDGEVTMLDLFALKLFIKQKDVPTDAEVAAGDIDGDGELTMVDSFELKYRISKGYFRE